MSAVLLENDLLHYEVLGRGRPVFFLHSWSGSWRYWIPCMQAASLNYRAYAFDLWGFGDSVKNQKYSLEDQAQLVHDFMDKMGIFRVALVGHGLGALVAIAVASRWPDLVDRIMGVACPTSNDQLAAGVIARSDLAWQRLINDGFETKENFLLDLKKNDNAAVLNVFPPNISIESEVRLEYLEAGCFFIYGRQDPIVTCPKGEDLDALPDRYHALIFEESGHFPFLEESSKFNRLLGDFLALESGELVRDLQLKEEWRRRLR